MTCVILEYLIAVLCHAVGRDTIWLGPSSEMTSFMIFQKKHHCPIALILCNSNKNHACSCNTSILYLKCII